MSENPRQVMITSIAQQYAEVISKYQDEFVCGFVDAWHDEPREPFRKEDILHHANMSYNMGYQIGAGIRGAWFVEEDEEEIF